MEMREGETTGKENEMQSDRYALSRNEFTGAVWFWAHTEAWAHYNQFSWFNEPTTHNEAKVEMFTYYSTV